MFRLDYWVNNNSSCVKDSVNLLSEYCNDPLILNNIEPLTDFGVLSVSEDDVLKGILRLINSTKTDIYGLC